MHLKISTEFSTAPGPRHRSEGKYSGEQFRQEVLFPRFEDARKKSEQLTVDLDGTAGYGTSFLEESFGGLIRENGVTLAQIHETIVFVSNEEPDLLNEIAEYLGDAERERLRDI